MPRLSCITILEAGSFGSDSGTVVIPSGEVPFPITATAVGTAAGIGAAIGVPPGGAVGTAAGIGAAAGSSVTPPLDGVTGVTGAYSFSRNLLTSFSSARYTDTSGAIDTLVDQTGNSRTLSQTVSSVYRPTLSTAGPNSRACGDFDGTDDYLITTTQITTFISTTAGYIAVSFVADAIGGTDTDWFMNTPLVGADNGCMGLLLKDTGTSPKAAECGHYDGTHDKVSVATVVTGTAYVMEWWHDAGNLYCCINNGTPASVASGTGSNYSTSVLSVGRGYTGDRRRLDGKIFEIVVCSAVPASRATIAADMKTHIGA